ncbi:hexokinase family protein [Sunxiuqinia sp. A32]|uniref:hexokinase family protein n=1 Tax=Sunxiuqinia sp. A32 TaxID=3461496 RepID=UPI004045947D
MNLVEQFLKDHKISSDYIDMQSLVTSFIKDMEAGLEGKSSSLMMIPTFIETDKSVKVNEPVIAVDAGGTNLRMAKVYFDDELSLITEDLQQSKMPAVDRELSKKEFFDTFASYLEDLKSISDKIGFCFSYPTEIYPNKDGKLIEWSKEVKAPEVIGEMIGENLLAAMDTPDKNLVLLNDTVATLLAGKAVGVAKEYDTYIGFILGTGTNTSYIELNQNISKTPGLNLSASQIINIESGNFDKTIRTDIDLLFDSQTKNPGRYTFEKMFSGGYLGGLCTTALKIASLEGIFSHSAQLSLDELDELSSEEVNKFICGIDLTTNRLADILIGDDDQKAATLIIEALIERAAKLVAANLAAVILKTDLAKGADKTALLTIEGTTFYKLKNLKKMVEVYLDDFLKGENKRYYEFAEVKNSSLLGAAIAAIVN